jgi:hypothetical protein
MARSCLLRTYPANIGSSQSPLENPSWLALADYCDICITGLPWQVTLARVPSTTF